MLDAIATETRVIPGGAPGTLLARGPAVGLSLVRSILADRRLDWWAGERVSVRVYDWTAARGPTFCAAETTSVYAVLDGEIALSFGPAQQSLRASAGESCLVLGGTPHVYRIAKGSRFVAVDLAAHAPEGAMHAALSPREARTFERAHDARDPLSLAAAHDAALGIAGRARLHPLRPAHSTARMLAVKRRLERGLADSISLGEIASEFRLDPAYLSREFRANFGGTPSAYVRLLRMERFLRSLRRARSEAALLRASVESGFGDYPTLSRLTRAWFGAPPSRLVVGTSTAPKPSRAESPILAA